MALGSLANTMKLSGTKVNTVIIDDDWTTWSPKEVEPAPKEYLDFNTPPLALVLAMQEAGKQGYEIGETLIGMGARHHRIDNAIKSHHHQHANEIYSYFSKKHTLRRIKGDYISEFMLAVDDLCENRKRIDKEHVAALISLPRIYNQNCSLERVMKGRKSAPKPNDLHFPAMTGTVEFVEKIYIKHGNTNEMHYFFSTPKNYLMRIVVKKGEYGETAWDVLARAGKLLIDSPYTYTYNVRGYDFNVIQPSPEMEVKINEN